jgi:hypothetical protein
MKAYVNGIPCTVYDFLDGGKICIVKYDEYPNLLPVMSSLIEVRDE